VESFAASENFEQADFAWATTTDGIHHGCCLLKLTARDMHKLGQLYLSEGAWDGKQILSATWIAQATRPTATPPDPAGSPRARVDNYGYLWWLGDIAGHRFYSAAGSDGQLITVIPDLRAVITVSSRSNPDLVLDALMVLTFIEAVIIPRIS
jgi:CubicO group peptidase (beta-lactamase class C family)